MHSFFGRKSKILLVFQAEQASTQWTFSKVSLDFTGKALFKGRVFWDRFEKK
jgi:hypothetical protein